MTRSASRPVWGKPKNDLYTDVILVKGLASLSGEQIFEKLHWMNSMKYPQTKRRATLVEIEDVLRRQKEINANWAEIAGRLLNARSAKLRPPRWLRLED